MKLVIQTSSGFAQLCLINGMHLHASLPGAGQTGPRIQERDLASLTRELLAQAGLELSQVSGLAVDIGPGRLAATRMAVAFVNALSFARQLPLQALPAFSLLGAEAAAQGHPQALILRKASAARYYWGLVQGCEVQDQGLAAAKDLPSLTERWPRAATLVSDQPLTDPLAAALSTGDRLVLQHASPATLALLLVAWPVWQAGASPFPLPLTESAFNAQLK